MKIRQLKVANSRGGGQQRVWVTPTTVFNESSPARLKVKRATRYMLMISYIYFWESKKRWHTLFNLLLFSANKKTSPASTTRARYFCCAFLRRQLFKFLFVPLCWWNVVWERRKLSRPYRTYCMKSAALGKTTSTKLCIFCLFEITERLTHYFFTVRAYF